MLAHHGVSEAPPSELLADGSSAGGSAAGTSTATATAVVTVARSGSAAGTSYTGYKAGGSAAGTSSASADGAATVARSGSAAGTSAASADALAYEEFTQTFEAGYRVADDSLALYELYVGEDGPPDFGSAPAATSATLDFTWSPTPPVSGTLELHCVVRQRNAYDLQSFNVAETILTIDSNGDEVLGPLTAPLDLRVYDGPTSGSAKVLATYLRDDDLNPADQYEVYAQEGSAPTPGVSTPVATGALTFYGEQAGVDVTETGLTPGATLYVIVSALRSSDSERASTAAVTLELAESLDLSAAQAFGGSAYEQR